MSPLTKAFVIVVAVLSILLVALVVPFVAKTQNFRALCDAEKNARAAAEQRAKNLQAEIALLLSKESERIADLKNEAATLLADNSQLRREKSLLSDKVTQLEAQIAGLDANLASLTASTKLLAELQEATNEELNTSRAKLVKQSVQVIELTDTNNELHAQLDGLTRQIQRLKENAHAAIVKAEQLEDSIQRLPPEVRDEIRAGNQRSGAIGRIVPDVPIVGRVTETRKIAGATYVEVDVGRNDGVEETMEFLIHRDRTFVGTMVIDKVDAAASAGRMELVHGQVAAGDSIYAGRL